MKKWVNFRKTSGRVWLVEFSLYRLSCNGQSGSVDFSDRCEFRLIVNERVLIRLVRAEGASERLNELHAESRFAVRGRDGEKIKWVGKTGARWTRGVIRVMRQNMISKSLTPKILHS